MTITPNHRLVSTTEGRQRFPDLLQEVYGSKGIVGAKRYGRLVGAIVPYEAILMLAGEKVEPDVARKIRNSARSLLEEHNQI